MAHIIDQGALCDPDSTDNSMEYTQVSEHHKTPISARYECLDYEECENLIYRRHMSAMSAQRHWKISIMRWGITLLIGVCTGIVAFAIDFFTNLLSNFKFSLLLHQMNAAFLGGEFAVPYFTWIFLSLFFVLIPAVLTLLAPAASGSGIPQIKCFLNGVKIPQVVRIKTFLAKFVGVVFSVAAGLPIGKEGPMIHSGAVIAGLSQGRSSSMNFDLKILTDFRLTTEQRDFVSLGAAAGASAAFGAPIGGLMFSLEEGSSFWNLSLIWRTFFASVMSTFTLNILRTIIDPRYGFSSAGLIDFGTFDVVEYGLLDIFMFAIVGIIGGLLGALFVQINYLLTVFRFRHYRYSILKIVECLLVVGVLSALSFMCVANFDECYVGSPPSSFDSLASCPGGESSVAADYIFTTPSHLVKKLFHNPDDYYSIGFLLKMAVPYYLASCWTYGINIPSGLFLPSMVIGATWGRLFAQIFNSVDPSSNLDVQLFALVGAAAQLGGNLRIVITLAVIIIEATATASLALPVIIALILSKSVGDYFNEGIFDMHIHVLEIPLLDWEPPALTAHICASKLMAHPVTVIVAVVPVRAICELLKQSRHQGFPVVDGGQCSVLVESIDRERFQGIILRHQLLNLLQHKTFVERGFDCSNSMGFQDIGDNYFKIRDVDSCGLTDEDMNCTVDLRPYVNPTPYTVDINTSFAKIFRLVRNLGLRHILVTDHQHKIVGIITRKDIAQFRNFRHDGKINLLRVPVVT